MAKYYVSNGHLRVILHTDKSPMEAACEALCFCGSRESYTIDREVFVDERGMRNKTTADEQTMIFDTDSILEGDCENNS
jgi:hypothetical protein